MRLLSLIVLTLAISLGSGIVSGQVLTNEIKVARPNLAGSWRLSAEPAKSARDENVLIVITQTQDSVTVTFRLREQKDPGESCGFMIYTDGRKTEISGGLWGGSTSVTGEWRAGKLYILRADTPRDEDFIAELELSAAGNRLFCRSNGKSGPLEQLVLDKEDGAAEKPRNATPNPNGNVLLQDIKISSRPN